MNGLIGLTKFAALVIGSRKQQVPLNDKSDYLRTAVPKGKISLQAAEAPSYEFRSELRVFLKWTLLRQLIKDTWPWKQMLMVWVSGYLSFFFFLPSHLIVPVNFWFLFCPIQPSVDIFYDDIKHISQNLLSTFHSMRNDLFMNCVTFQE